MSMYLCAIKFTKMKQKDFLSLVVTEKKIH
jgi:hypothetical protein